MAKTKKKSVVVAFDMSKRTENIKILVQSARPKEAIAYIYLIYNDYVKHKFNKPRAAFQTIREYAITCVNELKQKPELVYPFIKKIEDIIYGGVEPTQQEFNNTLQLFSNLYKDISGKTFSFRL